MSGGVAGSYPTARRQRRDPAATSTPTASVRGWSRRGAVSRPADRRASGYPRLAAGDRRRRCRSAHTERRGPRQEPRVRHPQAWSRPSGTASPRRAARRRASPPGRSKRPPRPGSSPRSSTRPAPPPGRRRSGRGRSAAAPAAAASSHERVEAAFAIQVETRRAARRPGRGSTFRQLAAAEVVAGAAEQEDDVALALEPAAEDPGGVLDQADHADDRRRVDAASVGLVVERDVAAGDRHVERAAGLADPARSPARAGP